MSLSCLWLSGRDSPATCSGPISGTRGFCRDRGNALLYHALPDDGAGDGRCEYPDYLFQVKTAAESKSNWDLYKLVNTTPPEGVPHPLNDKCHFPTTSRNAGGVSEPPLA
jgi:hypothetical protein